MSLVSLWQGNVKKSKKLRNTDKIANIDKEFLHIFWTTWGNSMKFSGKMCFKIILKVTLSLEDTFFEKPKGGGQFDPPPLSTDTPGILGSSIQLLLKFFPWSESKPLL